MNKVRKAKLEYQDLKVNPDRLDQEVLLVPTGNVVDLVPLGSLDKKDVRVIPVRAVRQENLDSLEYQVLLDLPDHKDHPAIWLVCRARSVPSSRRVDSVIRDLLVVVVAVSTIATTKLVTNKSTRT